ncbi:MAG: Stk1 family PASTA domain-containing Ser/Thr kinase [Rothia sp. (in: high G+C Gram-positive bacteria)]|nr:Stk1 family PASTA domain-containing Ser/Thr kinase [Rothia sp. (in: high G+C Gram-positive bacteria)]
MDQQVPKTIDGRYEVGAAIGSGAMATVYEAVDTRLGRKIALKVLRIEHAQDVIFRARFQREAEAVAALNHHSIVAVYDTGDFEATVGSNPITVPYMVMELVQGTTLRDVLRQGPLDQDAAIGYGVQILDALEYSHKTGIVHRDIKPANVMVLPQTAEKKSLGDVGQVKVMDFGIARAAEDAGESLTKANTVMGTARYISPEQARGETVDARSDIYSAACVVYEMVAGRSPFDAPTNVELAGKHLSEAPQAPSVYADQHVSTDVDRVILKGLQKNADDRYQSAAEFSDALKGAVSGVLASDDDPTEATTALSAASLGAVAASSAVAAGGKRETEEAGIGTFFDSAQSEFTDEELYGYGYGQDPEKARKKRRRSAWGKALTTLLIVLLAAFGVGSVLYYQAELNKVPVHAIPAVQGMPRAEAETALRNLNYPLKFVEEHSDQVEKGSVIKTSPATGMEAEEGTEITVTVSSGPAVVTIPENLAGQSEQYVREALTQAGFVAGRTTSVNSATVPNGMVVGVTPGSGEQAPSGSTVDIILSNGKVEVPSLVGLTRDQAIATLTGPDTLLSTNIENVTTSSQPAGTVISQSAAAGTLVEQGATVTIRVAVAPAATVAPRPSAQATQPPSSPQPAPSSSSAPSKEAEPSKEASSAASNDNKDN